MVFQGREKLRELEFVADTDAKRVDPDQRQQQRTRSTTVGIGVPYNFVIFTSSNNIVR